MLGVTQQEVDAFVTACERAHLRPNEQGKGKRSISAVFGKSKGKASGMLSKVQDRMDEHVRNSCLLAAPTGCASFQLKFGASTLHRVFGIPVGYCGPWKSRTEGRYLKMKTRLTQSRLFVSDEMSMVGRQSLGKIEFKVRDCLRGAKRDDGNEIFLGGRDTVLAGDPKQANPIGDEPMYREGAYQGKGVNKPRGSDRTPSDAWSSHKLVNMGMMARNTFQEAILLREVHRISSERADLKPEQRGEFSRAAAKFLHVMRGMADCTWTREDHAWLKRRNRCACSKQLKGVKNCGVLKTRHY